MLANTGISAMDMLTPSLEHSPRHKIGGSGKAAVIKDEKYAENQLSHVQQSPEGQLFPLNDILQDKAVSIVRRGGTYPVYINIFLKKKLKEEAGISKKPITELLKTEWEECKKRPISLRVTGISFTLGGTQEAGWKIFCQPSAPVRAF
jgi:hypothetical protein